MSVAETAPLLGVGARPAYPVPDEDGNKDIVDFDADGDAENPLDWPLAYKWGVALLLALMAFTVTFTCISVVPMANAIVADLNQGRPDKSASVLLVTIWELGEACGPLFMAPVSEVFGRYPVLNVANVLFIGAVVLAATAQSTSLLIAARALNGLAVATNVLCPAVIGDMFPSEQRGSPMSLVQLAPLIGGAVGPAMGGAIAEWLGWRSVLWMAALLATLCELLLFLFLRETYKVPILGRKAARLRVQTGNPALRSAFEGRHDDGRTGTTKVRDYVLRPFVVFFDSGVLQLLSVFGAAFFAVFYVVATTLPTMLQDKYSLTATQTGLCFISFSVGAIVSVVLCNTQLDKIYISLRDANKGFGQPEFRLPLVLVGGFALPGAVALYGWVAQRQLPLALLLLSVGLTGAFLLLSVLPVVAYVVDAFGVYSASALTALIVTRCLMGTFLPLAVVPLVDWLGFGLGLSLVALVLLALVPFPLLLLRYGSKWRQSSAYTRDRETDQVDVIT